MLRSIQLRTGSAADNVHSAWIMRCSVISRVEKLVQSGQYCSGRDRKKCSGKRLGLKIPARGAPTIMGFHHSPPKWHPH